MFDWLNSRPASYRRPARPASTGTGRTAPAYPMAETVATIQQAIEEEIPLAVAVLDEPTELPPPPKLSLFDTLEARLAALPEFPPATSEDRAGQLLDILRTLDRIAGDVCLALDDETTDDGDPTLPRKPR